MIRPLLEQVTQLLLQHEMRIATAESCTGGLLAHYLTSLSGSSQWFECGWVTYSNGAKHAQLDVPLALINEKGAVSLEVATAMAEGALKNSGADLAISVTGIAGPNGGSKYKPVGTVCFGLAMQNEETKTRLVEFPAFNRERIQLQSCLSALKLILSTNLDYRR